MPNWLLLLHVLKQTESPLLMERHSFNFINKFQCITSQFRYFCSVKKPVAKYESIVLSFKTNIWGEKKKAEYGIQSLLIKTVYFSLLLVDLMPHCASLYFSLTQPDMTTTCKIPLSFLQASNLLLH